MFGFGPNLTWIANNKASDGGGIAVYNSSQQVTHVDNTNGVLTNNTAIMNEGNIFVFGDHSQSCRNVTLVGMTLVSGLASYGGNLALKDCSLSMLTSKFYSGSASTSGGAIFLTNSDIWLESIRIEHNKANAGGGIGLIGNGKIKFLKAVQIVHNMALYGGGIALQRVQHKV